MRLICLFKGHTWYQVLGMDFLDRDDNGHIIWGPEYIEHYLCTRCDKTKMV